MRRSAVEDRLAPADRQLEQEGFVEVELPTVGQLVSEPPIEPLGRHGPYQSGIAYVSSVLGSLRRLPDQVTVRVLVNDESFDEGVNGEAEKAFRDYCRFRAEDACRQAMTVRQTGIRQMPRALVIAAGAAALAAACASIGQSVNGVVAKALLYVIGGIGAIAAWVITWMPIEERFFDWRPPAHVAAVFDLLCRARLEFHRQSAPDRSALHSSVMPSAQRGG
jgi:hypothetical protein